jgi:predicted CoA-substrate-specific enzyme activase
VTPDLPVAGIDLGSVAVGLVLLGPDGKVLREDYRFHRGDVRGTLLRVIADLGPDPVAAFACTSSAASYLGSIRSFDSWVCFLDAARHVQGKVGSLLVVGGEKFALLRFDRDGKFRALRTSTSCAAGTGSFLDQQAGRLGLAGSAELAERALQNRGAVPKIASRCAVFAKTDLCHAQQTGYRLEEICDGLCLGLARNIVDTVTAGQRMEEPVLIAGGVSRNRAVVRHIEGLLGCAVAVPDRAHLFGALGAAFLARSDLARGEPLPGPHRGRDLSEIVAKSRSTGKGALQEPLELRLSEYPDFRSQESSLFQPVVAGSGSFLPVERDLYVPCAPGDRWECVLGIDIGSTSTKAVLLEPGQGGRGVLAGFYTRTAGRPLVAVQAILEALWDLAEAKGLDVRIVGAGTTGAGRAFVGKVIGADHVLNEITAHARAAVELDPEVDTIIEIGGQDAKFTVLREGRVTFCQMNTVCAAGTGSFIEEQAARLGVPLAEYAVRAEGRRAPLTSDRCTVFMERDINDCLSRGHAVEGLLAAVLHSVRENYLRKVACEALIGDRICFQGATARNRALVAAFEQRFARPIFVSRFCHLTGALGVALALAERLPARSRFRGIDLYREPISVRGETCGLCANHCKLQVAEVQGETVAYGFLCGRDYDQKKFVGRNRSGFDMIREYRRAVSGAATGAAQEDSAPDRAEEALSRAVAARSAPARRPTIRVGIPAALYLLEEIPLWKRFFSELGIETVTSEGLREGLRLGREVAGAEFCAPITALHGHALWLAERCDAVFLPISIEGPKGEGDEDRLRYHCYYSQFAPPVVSLIREGSLERKCLTPLVSHGALGGFVDPKNWRIRRRASRELWKALRENLPGTWSLEEVARAYRAALAEFARSRAGLARVYESRPAEAGKVRVVLAGRPYQALCPELNKGIPDIFGSLGVEVFWQDMLPRPARDRTWGGKNISEHGRILAELQALLDEVHWRYAARILETAAFAALTNGLYPVLLTAFKCAPDAFIADSFRRLLESSGKPYLVLQIDDHDFRVGYETRIEAALDAFQNHLHGQTGSKLSGANLSVGAGRRAESGAGEPQGPAVFLKTERKLDGKTLLLPNWEPLAIPLVAASLRRAGVDARVLEEDEVAIRKAMRFNTGQCIPANAIAQDAVDYMERHGLDPARTVLWMPRSDGACNLRMFPTYIQGLFQRYGRGMEKARVYVGDLAHSEISPFLGVDAYLAYWMGGLLRRMACRVRPYETEPGRTDKAVREASALFEKAFLGKIPRREALQRAVGLFESIPRRRAQRRPKVAIFGDLYVRDNEVMNQDLIRHIERCGGEVVTTPYSDYLRIIAAATFRKWLREGHYLDVARYRLLLALAERAQRRLLAGAGPYGERVPVPRGESVEDDLGLFRVRLEHHGEAFDNILKVRHLARRHPDLALFVQASPAFCCPSLVTEAMARRIEEATGVPVVTVTYDGTGAFQNDRIAPYLAEAARLRQA